ncbi:hypothetical protein SVIOM74S_08764 [Streptomyces violarus]
MFALGIYVHKLSPMVLSAILIGGLYPAIVQKFQVQPNEQAKEAPYVEKNLEATRKAYGIDGTKVTDYSGTSKTEDKTTLRDDVGSTASIRIMDPNIVSPTSSSSSRSGTTTRSRTTWTSTATPRTARSRTPSSACAS